VSVPSTDLPPPAVALVVAAHPDDAEFQAGATLAKWCRAGTLVHHLVLTDGSKGTWDPGVDVGELVVRREQEQRRAAAALGATGEVVFLGEVDGELRADVDVRGRVAEVVRRLRPEVVLGHDPWKRYRLHPDHHAAGRLCVDGIVAARDPFFHPEQLDRGLAPHRPEALLLFEPDEVDHVEHVGDEDLEAKLRALEAHESQLATTHFYKLPDGDRAQDALAEFRARERSRLLDAATAVGEPGRMSEVFHLIRDQL
jgi:LmbE family N-acetylglucosaminyl deacetylase